MRWLLSIFIYSLFLPVSLGLCASGADLDCACFLLSPHVFVFLYNSLSYHSPGLSSSGFCHPAAWSNGVFSTAPTSFPPVPVVSNSITCADLPSHQAVQKISGKFSISALFSLFSHLLFITNSRSFSETSFSFLLWFLGKCCHCSCVTGLKTNLFFDRLK